MLLTTLVFGAPEFIYSRHDTYMLISEGEKSVLSAAIPILLWRVQGRSFSTNVA